MTDHLAKAKEYLALAAQEIDAARRSEAGRKAVATKGPEGLKAAGRKAAATKRGRRDEER